MLKASFGSLIFALVLSEVTSWTIDLPEARKFLFEKNDRLKEYEGKHKLEISKQVFYSNREHSNSMHHEYHENHRPYARDYGYQSYMEKKVKDVVYEGSEYLDGLQRSIEEFSRLLENCSRDQTTLGNSSIITAASNSSSPPEAWKPSIERAPTNRTGAEAERCRRANGAREHVRRLAELATKTTKELQDLAYSRKYLKGDPHELSKEENELVLKLAWLLDRLALHTGYRPRAEPYRRQDYSSSTTAAPPRPSLVNASQPVTRLMMDCLRQPAAESADQRCRYPLPLPTTQPLTNSNLSSLPSSPIPNEQVLAVNAASASKDQELLIATDHRPTYLPYPHIRRSVRAVTDVRKPIPETATLSKKTAEDPAINLMKYFVKHKIWDSDNPTEVAGNGHFERFEVNNNLKHDINKRDIGGKKLGIPEDPFQDLSKYLINKKGVHFIKDDIKAQRIRDDAIKILNTKQLTPKEHRRRIAKLFRAKRSYEFERNVDKPRLPEDLFKDISYYVKNKEGTNLNNDFVQAIQLRAGLEQIFQTPNIETVRRYGANFNPLIPDPLMFGALRSGADNI